jgi:hypothetical protein
MTNIGVTLNQKEEEVVTQVPFKTIGSVEFNFLVNTCRTRILAHILARSRIEVRCSSMNVHEKFVDSLSLNASEVSQVPVRRHLHTGLKVRTLALRAFQPTISKSYGFNSFLISSSSSVPT